MKRKNMAIILMCLLLFIVGCTKKVKNKIFSCSYKGNREQINFVDTRIYLFNKENSSLNKYTQKVEFDYNNKTYEELEEGFTSTVKACDDQKAKESSINCIVNKDDEQKQIIMKLEIRMSELDENSYVGENLQDLKKMTYEKVSEVFTNSKYPWTCETYFE